MKIHTRKKLYRAWVKSEAKMGKINDNDGVFRNRGSLPDSSMKRDYQPTEGRK